MRNSDRMRKTIRSPSMRPDRSSRGAGGPQWSDIPARVWIFAVIAGILLFALFGFWALYLFRGRFSAEGPTPTAIIWTPTPSPTALVTPSATDAEPQDDETGISATPTASTEIAIGGYVKVVGTGGYGLSLREGPGPDYTRLDIAAEGDVFVAVEGPHTAAGSPWWRIRDPEDEDKSWWAVGNYLEPVDDR